MSIIYQEFHKFKLQGYSKNPAVKFTNKANHQKSFKNHKCNIGVVCGKINDIIGFDPDYYKWNDEHPFYKFLGHNDWSKVIKDYNTYTIQTPSGGLHFYFKYNELPQINSNLEIDIKSTNGYLVGEGSKIGDKFYECVNDTSIKEMPKELYDWLYNNLNYKHNKKTSQNEAKTNNQTITNINNSIYKYNFTDTETIQILKNLPESYIISHGDWLKTATAMKTINKIDVFLEFCRTHKKTKCKKKNDEHWEKNVKIINAIKNDNQLLMINHILSKCNLSVMLDYNKYKPTKQTKFDKDDKVVINRNKLGKLLNKSNDKGFVNIDPTQNYVIKSDTGTGKTTLFKKYIKDNNNPIISIVSRISLGNAQYNEFSKDDIKINNYQTSTDYLIHNGDSIIITIDSIKRLCKLDLSNYIVFLDEFNSMIEYLWTCPNLNDKRVICVKFLLKIMKECKQFICVDADISHICDVFLKFCDVEYQYIENEYKHNKGVKSEELFDYDTFISKIKKCMNKTGCLVPCDSRLSANTIFEELTKHHNKEDKIINNQYSTFIRYVNEVSIALITSENDDFLPLDDYDVVIYSPKIVYGLDSVRERPVFAHYKEQTISPKAMLQQIARNRNISKLYYIFYKKKFTVCKFEDFKDVSLDIIDLQKSIDFEILCSKDENIFYLKILMYIRYNDDCYQTNKFSHFKNLLNQRGFIDSTNYLRTDKTAMSKAEKDLKQNQEDNFDPKDSKYDKVKEILDLHNNEDIEKYKDYFLNQNTLQNHFNFKKFFFKNEEYWKKYLEKQNEFNVVKAQSQFHKCLFLKEILNLSKVDSKLNFTNAKGITKSESEKMVKKYEVLFRDRSKKPIDLTNDCSMKLFISKIYKKMFGANLIYKVRKMVDGNKKDYYLFNEKVFNTNYELAKHKIELKKEVKMKSNFWKFGNEKQLFKNVNIVFTNDE